MTTLAQVIARHRQVAAALARAEAAAAGEWTDAGFAALQARVLAPLRDEDRRYAAALEEAERTLNAAFRTMAV